MMIPGKGLLKTNGMALFNSRSGARYKPKGMIPYNNASPWNSFKNDFPYGKKSDVLQMRLIL